MNGPHATIRSRTEMRVSLTTLGMSALRREHEYALYGALHQELPLVIDPVLLEHCRQAAAARQARRRKAARRIEREGHRVLGAGGEHGEVARVLPALGVADRRVAPEPSAHHVLAD